MALPANFQAFFDPQEMWRDKRWNVVMHEQRAAYERRFFVHGLQPAAQALGFSGTRALWLYLESTNAAGEAADPLQRDDRSPVPPILRAVPAQWRYDLPDVNDRGSARSHNTYWREFSLLQMSLAWQAQKQSLPKALLAIAALSLAAERKAMPPQSFEALNHVSIRASLYWLVGYSRAMHDRYVAVNPDAQRDAYAACGLAFDFGPDNHSTALLDAAGGTATLTYATATRLQIWLRGQGAACGPVLLIADARGVDVAAEVFADADEFTEALMAVAGGAAKR